MTSELTIARSMREIELMEADGARGQRWLEDRFDKPIDLDYELDRATWYSYVYNPHKKRSERQMSVRGGSGLGLGSYAETIYSNHVAGTQKNTFTTEFAINDAVAMGALPIIPAYYFSPGPVGLGKTLRVIGGVIQLGTSSTPPTWQVIHRLNPVVTPANPPTGPNVGGMTAGVTGTTTASTLWRSELDIQFTIFGAPGNNSTVRGVGMVWSPTGFVSPFMAALLGGGASPGTVATVDFSLLNTLTYGVVCGTSLAANQVQLVTLIVIGLN